MRKRDGIESAVLVGVAQNITVRSRVNVTGRPNPNHKRRDECYTFDYVFDYIKKNFKKTSDEQIARPFFGSTHETHVSYQRPDISDGTSSRSFQPTTYGPA